ncbi:MAG: hypothetical protein ABI455_03010 [Candidatus Dormiibacterota bacterium]
MVLTEGLGGTAAEWLPETRASLVAMAIAICSGAGAGALVFRKLIVFFTCTFTARSHSAGSNPPGTRLIRPSARSWPTSTTDSRIWPG